MELGEEPTLAIEPIVAYRAWGIVRPRPGRPTPRELMVATSEELRVLYARQEEGDRRQYLCPVADPTHGVYSSRGWVSWPIENIPWAIPGWVHAKCEHTGLRPGTYHMKFDTTYGLGFMGVYPRKYAEEGMTQCTCGMWGAKSLSNHTTYHALRAMHDPQYRELGWTPFVVGEVELAGAVLEHTEGYRGEKGRIRALYDTGKDAGLMARLSDYYQVPVIPTKEWATAWLYSTTGTDVKPDWSQTWWPNKVRFPMREGGPVTATEVSLRAEEEE